MSKGLYGPIWQKEFQEQRDGIIRVSEWDLFATWDDDTAPQNRAEDQLFAALDILYGHGDMLIAIRFLKRTILIAQRAVSENKVQAPRCRETFPENRGSLLRSRVYAEALLGQPFEKVSLQAAFADWESATTKQPRPKWDDFQEVRYLQAIRLALLSENVSGAQRLFQRKRTLRSHDQEFQLLKQLTVAFTASMLVEEAFRIRFDVFFDQVRDPAYNPSHFSRTSILRLEVGLLRDKYLISPDYTIDWPRAIAAIAE